MGVIQATPNPIVPGAGRTHGTTTLTWTAADVDEVEIRVGAPDGPLLARGGLSGTMETGPWVGDWTTFFLQDVSNERPLTSANTLNSVCARVSRTIPVYEPDNEWCRERERLRSLPRYQRTTTTLLGRPFDILDPQSFLTMYDEIVGQGILAFEASGDPFIIDCGANVGVSVGYFKQLFPSSRILAFEPDPNAFAVLSQNLVMFQWNDVTLVNKAVADRDEELPFVAEGSWAGRLARSADKPTSTVAATRLKSWITDRVDLLKLDIEGAETQVLVDCSDRLHLVDRIVVEFHSFADEPQMLDRTIGVLTAAGYRLYVRSLGTDWALQPFLHRDTYLGMDLQLYIYAFRTPPELSLPEPR